MTELKYFHGDVISREFPEHLDWFVPGLLDNLNRLVADFKIKTTSESIDYGKYEVVLSVENDQKEIRRLIIDFRQTNSLDNFICVLIDSINDQVLSSLGGFIVIAHRPFNESNITLTLGNWVMLETIDSWKKVINNPEKFRLSKKQGSTTYSGIRNFKDFNIKYCSQKFEVDYMLPFFPEDKFKIKAAELLSSIASLDKNSSIQFEVTSMTTEEAKITFFENEKKTQAIFNVRDFDQIGHELNNFKEKSEWRFVLIKPDEDNLLYAFCSQDELLTLEKYGFIRKDYLTKR